jgi:peroxiredoxin
MSTKEIFAALVAALLGIPAVFMFGTAITDGTARAGEAPLRAVLGDDLFDRLDRGEQTPMHYWLGRSPDAERLRAPDFTLRDRRGRQWSLADQRGKVIVMNFWTITCQPCLEEMPTLDALARIAAEDWGDVEVVTVSTDRGWDAVATVLPAEPATTVLFDPEKEVVTDMFGTSLYPETWIIDRDGIIRFRYDGALDWSDPLVLDVIELFR